jgi:hypothetical protein
VRDELAEVYGVFFRDGHQEYLVAWREDEDEALELAEWNDQRQYESALDEDYTADWEDFEGLHYVEPIARGVIDDEMMRRGFAQRIT